MLVSRGELVEIGDGFRIPEVLARRGPGSSRWARRTARACATTSAPRLASTAAILRVHQSNFRIVGFVERPGLRELAGSRERRDLSLVDDLGSGALDAARATSRPRAGARGGRAPSSRSPATSSSAARRPGIVAGRADLVERVRRHPLQRALRADKLTLAALEGTLGAVRADRASIPVLRMLARARRARARAGRAARGGDAGHGRGDGRAASAAGRFRSRELPSFACALPEELAVPLRWASRR